MDFKALFKLYFEVQVTEGLKAWKIESAIRVQILAVAGYVYFVFVFLGKA